MSDFFDFDPENDEVVDREVIEHDKPATDRSIARRIALQALYEIDSANHGVGEVITHNLGFSPDQRTVRNYIVHLVRGIVAKRFELDQVLQKYAPDWPINQVAVVDRNILRIALFELGVETRTPVSVAIDEAVELAKLYGAENTPRFVNGVLGAIAENLDAIREYISDVTEFVEDADAVSVDDASDHTESVAAGHIRPFGATEIDDDEDSNDDDDTSE